MGDTVWSQFLGAHEITYRDTVSYLRQGQHLCPEHTAGWKLSGPIWRARWGECHPCRPHGGWMTVLCDSSLQFYWHRQTYIYTFTYDELTCICWLGRRSTNRIIHMPQSHYMHWLNGWEMSRCDNLSASTVVLLAYHVWWMSPAVVVEQRTRHTKSPTIGVTEKTPLHTVVSLHSQRWVLQTVHQISRTWRKDEAEEHDHEDGDDRSGWSNRCYIIVRHQDMN